MEHLKDSEDLQVLSIANTQLTDAALVHLRDLQDLRMLYIRETNISLSGIVQLLVNEQGRTIEDALHVAGLVLKPQSEELPFSLDLHNARITDADLEIVVQLGTLDTLLLQDNAISDLELARLAQLRSLRQLWVSGRLITGQGLVSLKRLVDLETLWLTDTQANEEDLRHLIELPRLRILNLSGMAFTSNGNKYLKALKSLEVLIIDSKAIANLNLKEINDANPRLSIILSQKKALAAIRQHERQDMHLGQGNHRLREIRGVTTEVMKDPLVSVFGDAHFERAEWFYPRDIAPHMPKHWKELTTVKTLDFFRTQFSNDVLSELGCLPMLETLRLSGSSVSDADLEQVGKLNQLRELDLNQTRITDEGLVHLKQLEKLENLSLRGTYIDQGISNLSELQNLRELDLNSTLTTDKSLKHLYNLSNLKRINLESTFVSEAGISELRKQLPQAEVACGSISEEERQLASHFGKLHVPTSRDSQDRNSFVDLRNRDDALALTPYLSRFRNLRMLRLGAVANPNIFNEVLGLSSLELLDLSDCNIADLGIADLQRLPHLSQLFLMYNTLDNDALETLQSLPELRQLWLDGAKFPDGIRLLGRLTKLEELYLDSTAVVDDDLSNLVELSHLDWLSLDSTRITKAALVHLEKLPNLVLLSLRKTGIVESDLIDFKRTHPKCEVYLRE